LKLSTRRGTAGTETIAAQHWSAARGLEGHRVDFAALIASDLVSLALSAAGSWTTKIRAASVTTRFATLRVSQVLFPIILLLSFGKGEHRTALGASDFNIWHDLFSMIGEECTPVPALIQTEFSS
jgi:hypothetical protein